MKTVLMVVMKDWKNVVNNCKALHFYKLETDFLYSFS